MTLEAHTVPPSGPNNAFNSVKETISMSDVTVFSGSSIKQEAQLMLRNLCDAI